MIGPNTTVRGTISGDEDLIIEGRVEGTIRLSADLTVADAAHVAATVEAKAVHLAGRLEGQVTATDTLVVEAGATLIGDVNTPRLTITDGARFKGRVEMDFEIPGVAAPRSTRRR
jgi:cytoskeletal protein CcmA (bactofilin family)